MTTSVIVEPGQTIAIGGLIQTSSQARSTKIPHLGDIPFLGVAVQLRDADRAGDRADHPAHPAAGGPGRLQPDAEGPAGVGDAEAGRLRVLPRDDPGGPARPAADLERDRVHPGVEVGPVGQHLPVCGWARRRSCGAGCADGKCAGPGRRDGPARMMVRRRRPACRPASPPTVPGRPGRSRPRRACSSRSSPSGRRRSCRGSSGRVASRDQAVRWSRSSGSAGSLTRRPTRRSKDDHATHRHRRPERSHPRVAPDHAAGRGLRLARGGVRPVRVLLRRHPAVGARTW